jgi:hypothetical protein
LGDDFKEPEFCDRDKGELPDGSEFAGKAVGFGGCGRWFHFAFSSWC